MPLHRSVMINWNQLLAENLANKVFQVDKEPMIPVQYQQRRPLGIKPWAWISLRAIAMVQVFWEGSQFLPARENLLNDAENDHRLDNLFEDINFKPRKWKLRERKNKHRTEKAKKKIIKNMSEGPFSRLASWSTESMGSIPRIDWGAFHTKLLIWRFKTANIFPAGFYSRMKNEYWSPVEATGRQSHGVDLRNKDKKANLFGPISFASHEFYFQ